MSIKSIEQDFIEKVSKKIRVIPDGKDRFRVFTPLNESVPNARMDLNWHNTDHDPDKNYTVDCRINGLPEPIFVYALFNNDTIRDATIALHRFNVWNIPHCPLGIFENKEEANRKVRARFDDVCKVQFSNMRVDRNEIIDYISKQIQVDVPDR